MEILGPRDQRTPESVYFEEDPRAHRVRPTDRAYGLGNMVQQSRMLAAPPAAAKVYDGVLDEHQVKQKNLVHVCAAKYISQP